MDDWALWRITCRGTATTESVETLTPAAVEQRAMITSKSTGSAATGKAQEMPEFAILSRRCPRKREPPHDGKVRDFWYAPPDSPPRCRGKEPDVAHSSPPRELLSRMRRPIRYPAGHARPTKEILVAVLVGSMRDPAAGVLRAEPGADRLAAVPRDVPAGFDGVACDLRHSVRMGVHDCPGMVAGIACGLCQYLAEVRKDRSGPTIIWGKRSWIRLPNRFLSRAGCRAKLGGPESFAPPADRLPDWFWTIHD